MARRKKTCKVEIAKYRYGFDDIDDELKEKYEDEDASFRELEQYLNTKIIETVLDRNNIDYLPGEAENYRRILLEETDNITIANVRNAEYRLENQGVDVDQLEEDLVSYHTMGTHLRDCIGVDTSQKSKEIDIESGENTIGSLISRTDAVINRTLERLRDTGKLSLGEFTVNVSARVTCEECGRTTNVFELTENGGCECSIDTEQEPEMEA